MTDEHPQDRPGQQASRQIYRRVSSTFVLRVGYVGLEFLGVLLLARLLKATGYGVYAYVMAWVGVLAVPAAAGFDRLMIREVSVALANAQWSALRGLLHFSTKLVIATASIVALAFVAVATVMHENPEQSRAMLAGALLIPLLAYARVRQATLQGLGHVFTGQLPETLVQPGVFLLAVAAAFQWPIQSFEGVHGVLLQVGAATVACAFGVFLLRSRLPASVVQAPLARVGWKSAKPALPLVWMLAMNMALINLDTIALGTLTQSADAGVYRIASQMAAFVTFPLTAVNLVFAPRIAALYETRDLAALQATVSEGSRLAAAGAMPIAAGLILIGNNLLGLFGDEFRAGYGPLVILIAAYTLNSAVGVAGYVLIMTRFERDAAVCFTTAAAANLILCLILIPILGVIGAAISTGVSIGLLGITMLFAAKQRLGINSFALAFRDKGDS